MTYEEKYKKALGIANAKIETYYHLGNTSAAKSIEEIFPELAEIEDEKIREELIRIVSDWKEGRCTWNSNEIYCDSVLAWLEKQREQKPVEWKAADEQNLSAVLSCIKDEFLRRWLKDVLFAKYEKHVEWSEDDKWNTQVFCNALDLYKEPVDKTILKSWLKSLKDRVQPKQKCSEKDKKFIGELCNLLASIAKDGYIGRYYAPDLVESLKSLKPQQHWKPTETQLEALRAAAYESYKPDYSTLQKLYENLKQL